MVVVHAVGSGVTVVLVERFERAAVGLGRAVDREPIECVGDRIRRSDHLLEVQWCCVVVIVVGATAVTAELVEFTDEERIVATVVERVEDRDPVHRERDRSAEQPRARRDGFGWRVEV